MSRVFVATETALGRQVVVKVLSSELAGGLSGERFSREIQLAARLQHPNIVPLLSAGEVDGVPYYTMPFVDGESLRVRLQRVGELPVRDAIAILRDVARALDYAHAQGIVHRDIKPDNVLLSADYAVVTDFGVAKALIAARGEGETLTQIGVAIGTPAYMSPEQVAGDDVDQRADLYAFGCLAYELLTGAPPFQEANISAMFAAQATRAPTSVTVVRPAVPAPLAQLVMRCLEKRPADRPQNAREIIEALDAVTTPAGLAQTRAPASRRTLTLVAAALVVVAALAYALLRSRAPTVPVQDRLVAVTPFRVAGASADLRTLREGMLDLLSAKLSGDIHAVDPRTMLHAWRSVGGGDQTDLPQDRALEVSRKLGAGRLLQGEIVGSPQRLVISATLVASPSGAARATARVTGEQSALALLVDSLTAQLFVLESGATETQARRLAGIPFPALQAYLAGQALYRRGRYEAAELEFVRALDIDSTFAMAGIQLTLTGAWTQSGRSQRGLRVALQHYDLLGPRDRVLLDGIDQRWLRGYRSDCAEGLQRAERSAAEYPDIPEAWFFVGDRLFHCGWITAPSGDDPWRRSLAAFERALALDSTFAPAREHTGALYRHVGDSSKANAADSRMAADSSENVDNFRFLFLMMPDSAERRRYVERSLAHASAFASFIPEAAMSAAAYMPDGELALRMMQAKAATEQERAELARLERRIALNRGQPVRAVAATRVAGLPPSVPLIDAVFWDGDSLAAERALPDASRAYDIRPTPDSIGSWTDKVYAVAQYELARGDTVHAHRAITLMRAYAPPADRPWLADRPRQFALILDAQIAVRNKRADAGQLLVSTDSLVRRGPVGEWVGPVAALVVSTLSEQRGDLALAYAAVKRVRLGPGSPTFYSSFHLQRARVAAALGETKDALNEYSQYLLLRSEPEPSLRDHVAAVRKEMLRLESTTR